MGSNDYGYLVVRMVLVQEMMKSGSRVDGNVVVAINVFL